MIAQIANELQCQALALSPCFLLLSHYQLTLEYWRMGGLITNLKHMICTHSIGLFKEKETKSDLISKSSSKDSYAVKYVVQAAQINA